MRGNIWITFLCEGPKHAPPPASEGGVGGGESPSPRTTASRPCCPPDLPSPSRALSGRAFLAALKHAGLAHTVHQPFLRGGSPCVLPSLSHL